MFLGTSQICLTNPMHTDCRKVIGWSLRLSAAGEAER